MELMITKCLFFTQHEAAPTIKAAIEKMEKAIFDPASVFSIDKIDFSRYFGKLNSNEGLHKQIVETVHNKMYKPNTIARYSALIDKVV